MLFLTHWYAESVLGLDMSRAFPVVSRFLVVGNRKTVFELCISGRRIPVVRVLWEHVDWVRFPAARRFLRQPVEYENISDQSFGGFRGGEENAGSEIGKTDRLLLRGGAI